MRKIEILGEGNCIYNAFSLGVKFLIDTKSLLFDDLPNEFTTIAIEKNQNWKIKEDVYKWILQTNDKIILQLTLAPILRLTAAAYLRKYYAANPNESKTVYYLGREANGGIQDYFNLIEEPAKSAGDVERWGSHVEIDVLSILFKIGVQFDDGKPQIKILGVPYGYLSSSDPEYHNIMTDAWKNTLTARGVITKHYDIYVLNVNTKESIKPVKDCERLKLKLNQIREIIACPIDSWLGDLNFDINEKNALLKELKNRGAITTNFVLSHESANGTPGKPLTDEIEKRIDALPQALDNYITNKYRQLPMIYLELKGNHCSLYVPDNYNLPDTQETQQSSPNILPSILNRTSAQHFHLEKKRNDIFCLKKIEEELSKLNDQSHSKKQILHNIAILCGGEDGLSFNDNNDEGTYYIRNRYGYKVRNQGNLVNKNEKARIDFEILFRIKALIEYNYLPDFNLIYNDLTLLQHKIKYILAIEHKEDESAFKKNTDYKPSNLIDTFTITDLPQIKAYVIKYYPEIVLQRLTKELEELTRLQKITDPSAIYFFARKIVVAGELLHDYCDLFPEHKKQSVNNILSLFGRLNGLRNRFIHFDLHHNIIRRLSDNDGEILKVTILNIAKGLYVLINNNKTLDSKFSQTQEDAYKTVVEAINKLSYILSPNKKISIRKKIMNILSKTHRLFFIINSTESKEFRDLIIILLKQIQDKDLFKELERGLKDNNITYLITLISKNLSKIVFEHQATEAQLKTLINNLNKLILEQQVEDLKQDFYDFVDKSDIKDAIVDVFQASFLPDFNIKDLKYNDINTIRALDQWLNRLKVNAHVDADIKTKKLNKKNASPHFKLYSFLNEIRQKLYSNKMHGGSITIQAKDLEKQKAKFIHLKPEDREELSQEFNFAISMDDTIQQKIKILVEKNTSERYFNDPISIFSHKIHREMSYFESIETTNNEFKTQVFEHIVTLIGQYTRDIEAIAVHGKILLSNTAAIAAQTAKSLRSKGLAHEVFSLDRKRFEQKLLRHIAPSAQDFAAIAKIYSQGGVLAAMKTSLIYAELGDAFKRLCLYEQSIEYYYKALQAFSLEKPHDEYNQNSLQNAATLKEFGITQPTSVLLDHSEVIFGISIFELQLYVNLQEAYLKSSEINGAIRIFNIFWSRINFDKILKYKELITDCSNIAGNGDPTDISLSDKQKRQMFNKHSEYFNKLTTIINKISSIKRPFVVLDNAQQLFTSIADILHQYAKALMKKHDFENAQKYLFWSFDLITGQVKTTMIRNMPIVKIPTYDFEKMSHYYIDIAYCWIKQGQNDLALIFCQQAMSVNNLHIRLKAHALNYFIHKNIKRLQKQLDKLVKEFIQEFENKLSTLKKLSGDNGIESLEWYHKLKIDHLIISKDFSGLATYMHDIELETIADYGLTIQNAFPDLCWFVLASINDLFFTKLSKEEYIKLLSMFEEFLLKIRNVSLNKNQYNRYKQQVLVLVKKLIDEHYPMSPEGLMEVAELILLKKDSAFYNDDIIKYFLSKYKTYITDSEQLSVYGQKFLAVATEHFDKKNYELADRFFNPALKLLLCGKLTKDVIYCWYRIGETTMILKQYFKAFVAYQQVINLTKEFSDVKLTTLNAQEKSSAALKNFRDYLEDMHNNIIKLIKDTDFESALKAASSTIDEFNQFEQFLNKLLHRSINDSFKHIKGYLYYMQGIAYLNLSDFHNARESFTFCVEILLTCHDNYSEKIIKAKQHINKCDEMLRDNTSREESSKKTSLT